MQRSLSLYGILLVFLTTSVHAEDSEPPKSPQKIRVLLLGQSPDGHPKGTHEYMTGVRIIAHLLRDVPGLQLIPVKADSPWEDGPELLDGADAVVLFVSQGAKWIQEDKKRLAAFQALEQRGGAFLVLHWGMGTKEAKYIAPFLELFGACHGGPDRRYKVVTATPKNVSPNHPVLRGVKPTKVKEEFYFQLKQVKSKTSIKPLWSVPIEGESHMVAWAWQRPNGGRSFGFTGFHYHNNWQEESYRRLITQALLWSFGQTIPDQGVNVDLPQHLLQLPKDQEVSKQP